MPNSTVSANNCTVLTEAQLEVAGLRKLMNDDQVVLKELVTRAKAVEASGGVDGARRWLCAHLEPDKDGGVAKSTFNFDLVFYGDPELRCANLGWNEDAYVPWVAGDALPWRPVGHGATRVWLYADTLKLRDYLKTRYGVSTPIKRLDELLKRLQLTPQRDLQEWLSGHDWETLTPWDGVERAEKLFIDFLGAEDDADGSARIITKFFLGAAVRRAMSPGAAVYPTLLLHGPTSERSRALIRWLAGDRFLQFEAWRLFGSKKNCREAVERTGAWLVEPSEWAKFTRRDPRGWQLADISTDQDNCISTYEIVTHRRDYYYTQPKTYVWTSIVDDAEEELGWYVTNARFMPVGVGVNEPTKSVPDVGEEEHLRAQVWLEVMRWHDLQQLPDWRAACDASSAEHERLWFKCPQLQGHLPHDGRHTCATRLDNAGVDLKTQQLILGHRSASITRRVYTHKTVQQLLDAVNRL